MSEYTGVSQRHLKFIEKGERNPSLLLAKKIADCLNATIEELFLMRYKVRNIVKEWNWLDCFFSKLDNAIEKITGCFGKEEPDVEFMIEAETNHLKEENKLLKKLQYPRAVRKIGNIYLCPNIRCGVEISDLLIEKYGIKHCPECGQRIFINEYRKSKY